MFRPNSSFRIWWLPLAVALAAAPVMAQWQPNEVQVSAEPELLDFEFSQSRRQLTWVDGSGNVWIGNVDRATGLFVPPDGRGLMIDTGAAALGDALFAFNGPEWVLAAAGDQIVYTKFLPGQPKSGRTARIALARQGGDGQWRAEFLSPNAPRYIPFGSENPKDRSPSITYLDSRGNHYWRGTGQRNSEQPIAAPMAPYIPLRQVRGANAIVYPGDAGGVKQVYYYDLDTRAITQLTTDPGDKNAPWMWQAPEFGNEFVVSAVVGNSQRVYRKLPAGDGTLQWQKVLESTAPAGFTILSPEPFVYAGRSYVFMGMDVSGTGYSAEIWLANIDPAAPFLRRITAATPERVRSDPEVFITQQGARIYFNVYQLTSDPVPVPCRTRDCSNGVWMSDPGLPSSP